MAKATTSAPTKGVTTAKAVKTAKAVTPAQTTFELTPKAQKAVMELRTNRDNKKVAEEAIANARDFILEYAEGEVGRITANLTGTDKKGKRLVSIKVIPSTEKIDWKAMETGNPELYASVRALIADYIIPQGADKPTLRVDVI